MRITYKIKIILHVSFLIFLLCFFSKDVLARRGYNPEEEKIDSSFLKSASWLKSLQDYLRMETIYGDHKIDQFEVKYLVNAVINSQSGNIAEYIEPFAVFMTMFSMDDNTIETCISQVITKTNYSYDQTKRLLDEEIGNNRSIVNSVKPLCEQIVSRSGSTKLNNNNVSDWLLYQLLKTDGITPTIYSKFIIDNQLDICNALESLKYKSNNDDYFFLITDYILKESAQIREESTLINWFAGEFVNEQLKLAEASEYMSISGGNRLIDILLNTIPHSVSDDGEISYRTSIETPGWTFYRTLNSTRQKLLFRSEYLEARKNNKLLDFFSAKTRQAKQEEDKSWLLYRYHSELIQPLSEINSRRTLPSGYDKAELNSILNGIEVFK